MAFCSSLKAGCTPPVNNEYCKNTCRYLQVTESIVVLSKAINASALWQLMKTIDHPTQNFHSSPPGGRDTDKQNSSAKLAQVCLSLGHLTANHGTKIGEIYRLRIGSWNLHGLEPTH